MHILLSENQGLDLEHGVIEWIHFDGSKSMEPLVSVLKEKTRSLYSSEDDFCFFKGSILGKTSSLGIIN